MSGKEKAWPIALGISGSCSFHGEGRKLHWRQLDFWLGGIGWRIKIKEAGQPWSSSAAKLLGFGYCTETRGF